jgi:hypothetical protein
MSRLETVVMPEFEVLGEIGDAGLAGDKAFERSADAGAFEEDGWGGAIGDR